MTGLRVWIGFLQMCGAWATAQMCNGVSYPSDIGIFFKQGSNNSGWYTLLKSHN